MSIKMIIATGANFEIGQDGKLPWGYIKEDMEYFKEKTEGGTVIMGNTTFKGLPFKNGLPNRCNYVLTKEVPELSMLGYKRITGDSWLVSKNYLQTHLKFTKVLGVKEDTWIIGGASVYQQLLPYVDEIHWTMVEDIFPKADTHFDMGFLYEGGWERVSDKYLVEDMVSVSVWKRIK